MRVRWCWPGLALTAFACGAEAAPKSEWAAKPSPRDSLAALTAHAPKGSGGRAVMRCGVEDTGALKDCRVVKENPGGQGYGAALVSMAPKFRRKPPGKRDLREVNVVWDWFPVDTPPDWIRRPTPASLKAVLPREALERGLNGSATVSCIVTQQGSLADCIAIEESPPGIGFGNAAIALTPQLLMRPARLRGAAVPSTVNIPINWSGFAGAAGVYTGGRKVAPPDLPWSKAPTYAEVAAAYPAKAREAKVGGRATVGCDLSNEGRLVRCQTISVEPKGYGFEAAAKSLATLFEYPVVSEADRKAIKSLSVHLPVVFDPVMLTGAKPVIGKPIWAKLPDPETLDQAFKDVKISDPVRVLLACNVVAGGAVEGCKVEFETPAGAGVAAAGLALAPTFRLTPWTAEGLPVVGGQVRIPLRYQPGAAAKPGA